jgi:hypothetical protein
MKENTLKKQKQKPKKTNQLRHKNKTRKETDTKHKGGQQPLPLFPDAKPNQIYERYKTAVKNWNTTKNVESTERIFIEMFPTTYLENPNIDEHYFTNHTSAWILSEFVLFVTNLHMLQGNSMGSLPSTYKKYILFRHTKYPTVIDEMMANQDASHRGYTSNEEDTDDDEE